jgi:hypothetical protein
MEQPELMDRLADAYDAQCKAKTALEDAQAEVERLEALAPDDLGNELDSAHFPNADGAFEVKFKNSWATAFMARTFMSVLNDIGAKNYVEVGYVLEGKPLIVTIMHPDGDRPSVVVDRLTKERDAATEELRALRGAVEAYFHASRTDEEAAAYDVLMGLVDL